MSENDTDGTGVPRILDARGADIENQYLMCEADGDLYLIIGDKSRDAQPSRDVENPRDDRRIVP